MQTRGVVGERPPTGGFLPYPSNVQSWDVQYVPIQYEASRESQMRQLR